MTTLRHALLFGQASKMLAGSGGFRVSRRVYQGYKRLKTELESPLEIFKDTDTSKPGMIGAALLKFLDKQIQPPPKFQYQIASKTLNAFYKALIPKIASHYQYDFPLTPVNGLKGKSTHIAYGLVEWEDSILCQAIYRGACAYGNDFIITIPEVAELLSSHPDIKQNLPEDVFCIVRIISPFSDYGADYRSVIKNGGGFVQILPCKLIKKEANFRALDPLTYPKEIAWPPTKWTPTKSTISEDLDSFVCLDPFAFLVNADLIQNKRKGILERLRDHVWSQGDSDYFICYLSNVYRSEGTWRPMYSVGFGNLGKYHHDYKGPELELIEEWEAYFDKKIPITVLLQGRPGSGKTTLVKTAISHFHKKLKKRTLTMHSTSFTSLTTHEFHNIIEAYAPDILWIEDIDRIPQEDLELCLSKIDRQDYQVPLTIFTSNNYKKLPQALYRPDRIDYIYKIDVVEGKISDEVLESALKRVDLTLKDLTEDHLDALRSRCRGCTPAEILKYVRRGYVLGFDNLTSSYDLDVHMKDELDEK